MYQATEIIPSTCQLLALLGPATMSAFTPLLVAERTGPNLNKSLPSQFVGSSLNFLNFKLNAPTAPAALRLFGLAVSRQCR